MNIGFPISHKENEKRRAILPVHIQAMKYPEHLYFEKNYGHVMGIPDSEFSNLGCHICEREEILKKDIICDPKIGDADYLETLCNQTVFGWVHATQNPVITDRLIKGNLTVYAWEKMFYKNRHVFWKNNEIAGEAAVIHAFQFYGTMPYETKAAVIGRGNTARGAIRMLNMLGVAVIQYGRGNEELLREEIGMYDVIVNCVLWDVTRTDHIVFKSDLARMKRNAMIIDVSCDRNGGIETSIPTTIDNPAYDVDGILHYAVDHTPTLFYRTASAYNSDSVWRYIEKLMLDESDETLKNALIIQNGVIADPEITAFQKR